MRCLVVLFSLLLGACAVAPVSSPAPAAVAVPGPTGIAGRVVDRQGAAASGAYVYAYRSARGGLRGPADFEAAVGADGRYFLDLVEGDYHLVARARKEGAIVGPPRPGDAWALYPRNPVRVYPGQTSPADFLLQGIAQPQLMKEGTLTSGDTGFTGLLVDGEGRPLAGAFVIAYDSPDFQRMPDFTSPVVGEDGRFTLYVPEAGSYCLAARTRTRGQPQAGEPYGLLGVGPQGCREAQPGRLLEVGAIVLTPYRR